MTPELHALTLAAILQIIQFVLMAVPANMELGTGKTLSPRDADKLGKPMVELLSPRTARLHRALTNHFEALILFTIAVVVVTYADQSTIITQIAAYVYVIARVLYVPAYAFGWVPWRSFIWFTGLLATVIMLISALL